MDSSPIPPVKGPWANNWHLVKAFVLDEEGYGMMIKGPRYDNDDDDENASKYDAAWIGTGTSFEEQEILNGNSTNNTPASHQQKPVASKPARAPSQQAIFTLPSGVTGDPSALQNSQVNDEHNNPVPIHPAAPESLQSGISETAVTLGGMKIDPKGYDDSRKMLGVLMEPTGLGPPRKPCKCPKSHCLKLYCDCFANGEFCHLCNCTDCYNNLNHEKDRQKVVKFLLERNPEAFRPKIGKNSQMGEAHERQHNKGCNCRRSGCLKKYCECYEAKIFCSGICKCTGCKNCTENIPSGLTNNLGVEQHFAGAGTSRRQSQKLKDLAKATEVRVRQQTQVKNNMKALMQEASQHNNLGMMVPPVIFRYPHESISYDIVTSTVEVLLARAEATEKHRLPDGEMEKSILEEFGDCLSSLMELGNTIEINNNFK